MFSNFIPATDNWLICYFGLARQISPPSRSRSSSSPSSPSSSPSRSPSSYFAAPNRTSSQSILPSSGVFRTFRLTTGVGTSHYAAPEQRHSSAEFEKTIVFQSYFPENSNFFPNFREFSKANCGFF